MKNLVSILAAVLLASLYTTVCGQDYSATYRANDNPENASRQQSGTRQLPPTQQVAGQPSIAAGQPSMGAGQPSMGAGQPSMGAGQLPNAQSGAGQMQLTQQSSGQPQAVLPQPNQSASGQSQAPQPNPSQNAIVPQPFLSPPPLPLDGNIPQIYDFLRPPPLPAFILAVLASEPKKRLKKRYRFPQSRPPGTRGLKLE